MTEVIIVLVLLVIRQAQVTRSMNQLIVVLVLLAILLAQAKS
jgi:hypothetical protein